MLQLVHPGPKGIRRVPIGLSERMLPWLGFDCQPQCALFDHRGNDDCSYSGTLVKMQLYIFR